MLNKEEEGEKKINGFDRSVRQSEEISFRVNHHYIMSGKIYIKNVCWCHGNYGRSSGHFLGNSHITLLPLRVNQNLLVFFFELMAATCFYLSRNLFPSFGYGKLIIDLPMQVNNIMISLWPWPTVHINQKSVNSFQPLSNQRSF